MSGNYFLAHGIPNKDIFTYTASSFSWVDHEWLSDIIVSLLNKIGGYNLIAIFCAVLWTLAVFITSKKNKSIYLVLLSLITFLSFAGIRTIVWSILGLAVVINVTAMKSNKKYFLLPLIFLIWSNLHGSFLIGILYLVFIAIKNRSLKMFITTAISLCLTLINPYFINLYVEIFRTMLDVELKNQISEWQPFSIPTICWPYIILWIMSIFVVNFDFYKKNKRLFPFLFEIILFIASLSSVRMTPLFIVASFNGIYDRFHDLRRTIPNKLDISQKVAVIGMVVIYTLFSIGSAVLYYKDGISLDKEATYPKQVVKYIQKNNLCTIGNIFNHYNYGGYLIWKLPEHKYYIDGRMPSWKDGNTKYFDEYDKILKNESYQTKQFKKYNIVCAIVPNDESDFINSLVRQNWLKIQHDDSVLLIKH
jgi:hypothetical protein